MYFVSIRRVTGCSAAWTPFTGGNFSFSFHPTLTEAKEHVANCFKREDYNHADIYDQQTGEKIERFRWSEWKAWEEWDVKLKKLYAVEQE